MKTTDLTLQILTKEKQLRSDDTRFKSRQDIRRNIHLFRTAYGLHIQSEMIEGRTKVYRLLIVFILALTCCTKDPHATPCTCIYEDGSKRPCETVSPPIPYSPPIDMICY